MLPSLTVFLKKKKKNKSRQQHLPVEGQLVTRLDLNRVRCLLVAHHVASHINGVKILDRRIGVSLRRSCVVRGCPDTAECPLIDAVYKDTLPGKVSSSLQQKYRRGRGVSSGCYHTQMKQCACTRATLDAVKDTAKRAWESFMVIGMYATRAVVQLGVTRVREPGLNLNTAGSSTHILSYE